MMVVTFLSKSVLQIAPMHIQQQLTALAKATSIEIVKPHPITQTTMTLTTTAIIIIIIIIIDALITMTFQPLK